MISTELSTRILLTVIIVGALAIDFSKATTSSSNQDHTNTTVKLHAQETNDEESVKSSVDSPVSPPPASSLSSTSPYNLDEERTGRSFNEEVLEDPQSRLMSDSAESGILLPYDEDFPRPGGGSIDGARRYPTEYQTSELPQSVSFPGRPLALRIANGKALEQPYYEKETGKGLLGEEKATYYIRNNCFGPRCTLQQQQSNEKIPINTPEDWKKIYYNNNKEIRSKKYDDASERVNRIGAATTRYEDNVMESMSSNFHSQIAIPFVVVDDNSLHGSQQNSFLKKSGLERFSRRTPSTSAPITPEGWVKLKAISPDTYDPFRFSRNQSVRDTTDRQSTFSKRDSSSQASNSFSKRVGVELNPESFADRWGWSDGGDTDNRGGSRLPAWLEERLKYGNRNTDDGKNWVKLEPIPVAGVSISKWVPKGTHSQDLPTTSWQTNRDRPNSGGGQWWDRIDQSAWDRKVIGNRHPTNSPFLRPPNGGGGGGNNNGHSDGGWGSKGSGSSLSSFDRYPTNSWSDIIYPDGPTSATVSWQQNKGISSYPSSFGGGGGDGNSGGWPSGGDNRKPIVATGAWSAPPNSNNRFPSFINRFNDHRPSSYPVKQASEDDPRWILISNTRRVTSSGPSGNRGSDIRDRNKVLSYINRLHPDLDRGTDFPFYERNPSSHRHGKDFWPFPNQGTTSPHDSPNKDEAFHRLNATLSTLTPILFHRGGTTVRPPIVGTFRPSSSSDHFPDSSFDGASSFSTTNNGDKNSDLINSISSTLAPLLSPYVGDGRATISNAVLQSSTNPPVRNLLPGRIRQGLQNINPVYAAVGAGMIPATLAAVMPMVLGRRKRRDLTNQRQNKNYRNLHWDSLPFQFKCCITPKNINP